MPQKEGSPDTEESALQRILAGQIARYPLMQVQDLYKLIHQACMGSEHAVTDVAAARAMLEREVNELGDGPPEHAVETISPDGRIVRVHLRPYVRSGADLTLLLEAFVWTARGYRGSVERLRRYGVYAAQMAGAGGLAFASAEVEAFFEAMEAQVYPAVHHSKAYQEAYRPAYRVVDQEYLPKRLTGSVTREFFRHHQV